MKFHIYRNIVLFTCLFVASAGLTRAEDEVGFGELRAAPAASASKPHTVESRLHQFGAAVEARLAPDFAAAGVPFPPRRVVLACFKSERIVQLYAGDATDGPARFIREYPILGASGVIGPKRAEGDYQVPEGIYDVWNLNPNSIRHVSMMVGYPNAFDRAQARVEGRTRLGGTIMIHGGDDSIGCIAVGDEAAEDLFAVVARAGMARTRIVIAPADLRAGPLPDAVIDPAPWVRELYGRIATELARLQPPARTASQAFEDCLARFEAFQQEPDGNDREVARVVYEHRRANLEARWSSGQRIFPDAPGARAALAAAREQEAACVGSCLPEDLAAIRLRIELIERDLARSSDGATGGSLASVQP